MISSDICSGRAGDRGGLPGRPGLRRLRPRRRRPPQDRKQPAEGAKFEPAAEELQQRGRRLAGLDALLLQPGHDARRMGQRRGMAEIRSAGESNVHSATKRLFLGCVIPTS